MEKERQTFAATELRADTPEADAKPRISGHAAVFNPLSEMLWGFRKMIAPGAFTDAIEKSDVRALLNHDSNFVLGRTKNGTLRLWENERGLAVDINPLQTQWPRDLPVSIGRGRPTGDTTGHPGRGVEPLREPRGRRHRTEHVRALPFRAAALALPRADHRMIIRDFSAGE